MWHWFFTGSGTATKVGRDIRVDALRGVALLMIFINHVPANPLQSATFAAVGFSDAAEVFVFLAGYATALSFWAGVSSGSYGSASARLFARAGTLYVSHLIVFVLVAAMVGRMALTSENPLAYEIVNLTPIFTAPASALGGAVTLTYQPHFMDILPLYIVLLVGFPLVAWVAWRSPAALFIASLGLYLLAVTQGWNLPNGAGSWFFNPFAWQFLFVLGALAAVAVTRGIAVTGSRIVLGFALVYLVFAFFVTSQWSPLDAGRLAEAVGIDFALDVSKTDLSAWRLVNVLAFLYVAAVLVRPGVAWLSTWPVEAVAAMGRHSLPVFAVGVVLSVAAHIAVLDRGATPEVAFLSNAIGLTALILTGQLMEWYGRLTGRRRDPGRAGGAVTTST